MKRIQKIINQPLFTLYMEKNRVNEFDRVFCHHDFNHLIDVARIAYIISLENNYKLDKEVIYATSLLHDIGRWKEYENGEDHAKVSSELAMDILKNSCFTLDEISLIQGAIINHRNKGEHPSHLSRVLYISDKLSRPCNQCNAKSKCKRFMNGEKFVIEY